MGPFGARQQIWHNQELSTAARCVARRSAGYRAGGVLDVCLRKTALIGNGKVPAEPITEARNSIRPVRSNGVFT